MFNTRLPLFNIGRLMFDTGKPVFNIDSFMFSTGKPILNRGPLILLRKQPVLSSARFVFGRNKRVSDSAGFRRDRDSPDQTLILRVFLRGEKEESEGNRSSRRGAVAAGRAFVSLQVRLRSARNEKGHRQAPFSYPSLRVPWRTLTLHARTYGAVTQPLCPHAFGAPVPASYALFDHRSCSFHFEPSGKVT